MVVQAYILIQTDVGKAAEVAAAIADVKGVTLAEDVTGPYDVIVRAEASNVDELGKLVVARAEQHPVAGPEALGDRRDDGELPELGQRAAGCRALGAGGHGGIQPQERRCPAPGGRLFRRADAGGRLSPLVVAPADTGSPRIPTGVASWSSRPTS